MLTSGHNAHAALERVCPLCMVRLKIYVRVRVFVRVRDKIISHSAHPVSLCRARRGKLREGHSGQFHLSKLTGVTPPRAAIL